MNVTSGDSLKEWLGDALPDPKRYLRLLGPETFDKWRSAKVSGCFCAVLLLFLGSFACGPSDRAMMLLAQVAIVIATASIIALFLCAVRQARFSIRSIALLSALTAPCFAWLPYQLAVALSIGLGLVVFWPKITFLEALTLLWISFILGA